MKLDEQYKRATSNVVVKETEHIVRGSSVPVSPKPIVTSSHFPSLVRVPAPAVQDPGAAGVSLPGEAEAAAGGAPRPIGSAGPAPQPSWVESRCAALQGEIRNFQDDMEERLQKILSVLDRVAA